METVPDWIMQQVPVELKDPAYARERLLRKLGVEEAWSEACMDQISASIKEITAHQPIDEASLDRIQSLQRVLISYQSNFVHPMGYLYAVRNDATTAGTAGLGGMETTARLAHRLFRRHEPWSTFYPTLTDEDLDAELPWTWSRVERLQFAASKAVRGLVEEYMEGKRP